MKINNSFSVYNASAGSGKTFTLVKEYLKLLFKSSNKEQFKHILAVTFTNKAVGEMKERIIETLKEFSSDKILKTPSSMFQAICDELSIKPEVLHKKSEIILNTIIYNYSAFNISTIDGFTHKLIQTFAHDLKVPLNFEVELDTDSLLNEAVDSLIDKAGTDRALTKVLVEFAIEKTDDDKSWDVSYDFNKIAKLLVNENDLKFVESLKDKSLNDFKEFKTTLKTQIKILEDTIVEKSQSVLTLIEECGLEHTDFSSGYLPNYFTSLTSKNFSVNFGLKWQENLINNLALYPSRVSEDIASIIDHIQPQITRVFNLTKQEILSYRFLKAIYKNITPLSVLSAINQELDFIKKDQNKMLISEFNSIIGNEIKNQPTPFIYERIGEKFRHYFIDEFQDTSILQWENLIPLLDNSLSSENGTAMLVGDAKQAIYRWRGGEAEQFIGLFNEDNPFHIEKKVINLPSNYRSYKQIIDFNNHFFDYLSHVVFENSTYKELYNTAKQSSFLAKDGYVSINFLEINQGDDKDEIYTEEVYKTILKCLENNYSLKDICILVRKKKEGVAIANYLNEKEIAIISSETLLLNNSPEVVFINNILNLLFQPNNLQVKVEILNYIAEAHNIEDKHAFFEKHIHLKLHELFESLKTLEIHFELTTALQSPLYDMTEDIVRSFSLVKNSNAYVQFYLDTVLDYSQKQVSNLEGFLEYFEKKKDKLSIVTPTEQDAVQIMTIHKAKGLEFPVVIFPYADLNIYDEREPKEWYPLDSEMFNGFSNTLLNFNKDFENYGDIGKTIYNTHLAKQELDNINLLYVALTRPIEQLYIISKNEKNPSLKTFSGLFISYLQNIGKWDESQSIYEFGLPEAKLKKERKSNMMLDHSEFISTSKKSHDINIVSNSGYLWNTEQQNAIEKGNLVHNIMSHIKIKNDVDFVISDFINASIINIEQAETLKTSVIQILEHPKLEDYFTSDLTIYNERDILTKEGNILRPDRLVINSNNDVVIIDYKTGEESNTHKQQLQSYEDILKSMGYNTIKKILVYINDSIQVKEI